MNEFVLSPLAGERKERLLLLEQRHQGQRSAAQGYQDQSLSKSGQSH
ncbi:MAG: hypothetical protein RBT36_08655 [Desulfobulbus sp.]|nr:hypothetical protein [Desulfobulbus sp.]